MDVGVRGSRVMPVYSVAGEVGEKLGKVPMGRCWSVLYHCSRSSWLHSIQPLSYSVGIA